MRRIVHAAILTLLVSAPSLVDADEMKTSGSVTYVPTSGETIQLPDGGTLVRAHLRGLIRDDDPDSPFHLNTQDCDGTTVVAADGSESLSSGYCDGVDAAGDVWTLWWNNTGGDNTWGIVAGTGKFAGMTGGGTTVTEAQHADGRTSITYEGSLILK